MVQYGSRKLVTKDATDKFASLVRLYLNDDINSNNIKVRRGSFNYGEIKLKVDKVHELYDEKKEEEVAKLKALLDKKLIRPVNGVISHFKNGYGNGKKEMVAYNFDDFLERVGPKTVSDISSKLEDLTYFGLVNIALVGTQNRYNQIIVTPAISEPLGSAGSSFNSGLLENINPDEPGDGHDIGLSNVMELELYGGPSEKGF